MGDLPIIKVTPPSPQRSQRPVSVSRPRPQVAITRFTPRIYNHPPNGQRSVQVRLLLGPDSGVKQGVVDSRHAIDVRNRRGGYRGPSK